MYRGNRIRFSILPLAFCAIVSVAGAQGRGQGQGGEKAKEDQGRGQQPAQPAASRGAEKARPQARDARENRRRDDAAQDARGANRSANRGRDAAAARRGNDSRNTSRGNSATAPNPSAVAIERANDNARFKRDWTSADVRPDLRRFIAGNRPAEVLTAGALAHARARKVRENEFVLTPSGRQMLVRNRKGDVLVALDDDGARNLGSWRVAPLADRANEGAPSFCRSGAGHPQWGRQWCIDKGFGIGTDRDVRWGRNLDLRDVEFRNEPASAMLTRAALANVLGNTVVDRLALHAITLGLVDPLVGTWRADPAGPRVLLVNSGNYPVAEIVDVDRDKRSDRMVVALRPW